MKKNLLGGSLIIYMIFPGKSEGAGRQILLIRIVVIGQKLTCKSLIISYFLCHEVILLILLYCFPFSA